MRSTYRVINVEISFSTTREVINVDSGVNVESFIKVDGSFNIENLFPRLKEVNVDGHVKIENLYELPLLTLSSTLRTSSKRLKARPW